VKRGEHRDAVEAALVVQARTRWRIDAASKSAARSMPAISASASR
jgi:hypothetical protein